jgi:hypothetical protein
LFRRVAVASIHPTAERALLSKTGLSALTASRKLRRHERSREMVSK